MGFFTSYGKQKTKDAQSGLISLLVKFDPMGATEAEILEMRTKLEKVSEQTAVARQSMVKEKKEYEEIKQTYDDLLSAAELLETKVASATGDEKESFEKSLTKLVKKLEDLAPDVEREHQEAIDAEEYFKFLEDITTQAAEKLKTARSEYTGALRKMSTAKLKEQMAKDQEEAVHVAEGFNGDNFNTALGAIKQITDTANARTEAANKRKELLKTPQLDEDENIKNAINSVKGKKVPGTITERLQALKKEKVPA